MRQNKKEMSSLLFPSFLGKMIEMGATSVLSSVIRSAPQLVRFSLSLSWTYLDMGRQVSKTRRAFEKQLILQGMKKEDAQRLSTCFDELKNSLVKALKQGIAPHF